MSSLNFNKFIVFIQSIAIFDIRFFHSIQKLTIRNL